MSRLSIEALTATFAPTLRCGIQIERQALKAVVVDVSLTPPREMTSAEQTLNHPWFGGTPSPEAIAELSAALKAVAAPVARRYAAIQIALPDPALSYAVFEFEQIPKDARALTDLVRWRFAKDLHHDEASIICQCHRLGSVADKTLVFATAIDAQWHRALIAAIDASELVVAKLDSGAVHRLNVQAVEAEKAGAQALLAIEAEYWSVIFWDDAGRPRFVRARWRKAADDTAAIVSEVVRLAQAYRGPGQRQSLTGIRVLGAENIAPVCAALEKSLGIACHMATPPATQSHTEPHRVAALTALHAALV